MDKFRVPNILLMVTPCQALLYIVLLLVAWSISPSHIRTLVMLFTLLINLLFLLL